MHYEKHTPQKHIASGAIIERLLDVCRTGSAFVRTAGGACDPVGKSLHDLAKSYRDLGLARGYAGSSRAIRKEAYYPEQEELLEFLESECLKYYRKFEERYES